jgi:hypothetical protein
VKAAIANWERTNTGARISFRWQKSVGHIARLVHRESARSRGGKDKTLAGRKLEAPPDAGHEPREGEPVLRESAHPKVRTRPGPAAKAGGSSIRRKVLSGSRPPCPHRLCEAKSLARRSTSLMRPARARVTGDSASVGTEAGRACLRVTTGASEVGAVSVKAPRGPRRTEGGQHPPALKRRRDSGAPERMRPKLTTANSFVDPPLS